MRMGLMKQAIVRFARHERLTHIDYDTAVERRGKHLIGSRHRRELVNVAVEVFRVDDRLIWRDREYVSDAVRAAPVARPQDGFPPVLDFTRWQLIGIG